MSLLSSADLGKLCSSLGVLFMCLWSADWSEGKGLAGLEWLHLCVLWLDDNQLVWWGWLSLIICKVFLIAAGQACKR